MRPLLIKKRHPIRKADIADLMDSLRREIGGEAQVFQSERIEIAETDSDFLLYMVDKKPSLMRYSSWVFPTVRGAIERPFSGRRITVDAGAIPFVIKGADIMRPGIKTITDDVKAGSPALIADDRYGKPLAVCIALHDAPAMRAAEKGKMCKNIHYVGDDLWNIEI
ncbi:MAG: RNA-binding protein [Methanomicrobiales archaeon]|nr:RNA-binding protein [Methanomicrobiales archaeon]